MNISTEMINWQHVSEEGRKWLDSLDGETAQMERIKYSGQRAVFRHPAGVYVKKIYYNGLRSIFKTIVGGNAANEGRIALSMRQRGVPVPEIMAFGRITSFGMLQEDLLVTREINGKVLREFIENDFNKLDFRQKEAIINQFAEFVARLHDRGIYHRDFHLNNVLFQEIEGHIRFSILDLNKVLLYSGALSLKKRQKQLGILLSISCWGLCSRNERFRLQNYIKGCNKKEKSKIIKGITRAAGNHIHDLLSQRVKQSVGTNTRFISEISERTEVYRKREFDYDSFILEFGIGGAVVCEMDEMHEEVGKIELNNEVFFVKKYSNSSIAERIKGVFGLSMGRSLWKQIWRFPFKKIPIPVPLMMVINKSGRLPTTACLISEYLSESVLLHQST